MVLICAATTAAWGGVTYAPSAFSTRVATGRGSTEVEPVRLVSVMVFSFGGGLGRLWGYWQPSQIKSSIGSTGTKYSSTRSVFITRFYRR